MMKTQLQKYSRILSICLGIGWLSTLSAEIRVNQVVERSFTASETYNNPYIDVDLWVDLTGPNGVSYRVPAFWDGGQTFRVRLVATTPGVWTWTTGSTIGDAGLDNQSGTFQATAWTQAEIQENPNRRGFIRVAEGGRTLEYADGTPFFYTGDTWWTALTRVYHYDSDAGVSGISFKDAVATRKAQGFNGLNIIACYPSETLNGRAIWHKDTHGEKVAVNGSTPFVISNPSNSQLGVDFRQINPNYWQEVDEKMAHMSAVGFVPYLETVRRSEVWHLENAAEQSAFANYVKYLWARYGCYNMIFSWVHADSGSNVHEDWRNLAVAAYQRIGGMPYGQPMTVMTPGASIDWGWTEAAPGILDIHTYSNQQREGGNITEMRRIFNIENPLPVINVEPFYPGLRAGFNNNIPNMTEAQSGQFNMYGNVLGGGGYVGHAWGDIFWAGVADDRLVTGDEPVQAGDPHVTGFTRYRSATMGYLKSFILDEGHDFKALVPTPTLLVNRDEEFKSLSMTPDKSVGLGFFAANRAESDITGLNADTEYAFEWYNINTGTWQNVIPLTTDANGLLDVPVKPSADGWAFRIKTNVSGEPQAILRSHWNFSTTSSSVNITDLSGNGFTGVLVNGPTRVNGVSANAVQFDGVNDAMTVAKQFDPAQQGTVMFWMKADQASMNQRNRILGGHNYFEILLEDTGKLSHNLFAPLEGLLSETTIKADEWYHVACTYDHTTGSAELYVNGLLESTGNVATEDPGNIFLSLGTRTGNSSQHYAGALDDVRIYDNVLNTAQIRDFMNNGLSSHLQFNEPSGSIAIDSANGEDATIVNATRVDNALMFNGYNSQVEVPTTAMDGIHSEISIVMWVNGSNTQARADSVFNAIDSNGNRVLNIHLPWSNSLVYWDAGNEGAKFDRLSTPAPPTTYQGSFNQWVFTKNTFTGKMCIYVNGQLLDSGFGKTKPIADIASVVIGSDNLGRSYDGIIDDVKIYRQELSAGEVEALFTAEAIAPLASYSFSERFGADVFDDSGSAYHASVINPVWSDGSLGFNGSNSSVQIPAGMFSQIQNEITVSIWAKGASNQPRRDTIFKAVNGNGQRVMNIHLPWSNSQVYWDAGFASGTYDRLFAPADPATFKNNWNHWVFTKNATTGQMAIYVNGNILKSENGKTKTIRGITQATIGSDVGGNFSYSGNIDQFDIYGTTLSAEEVTDLYTNGPF